MNSKFAKSQKDKFLCLYCLNNPPSDDPDCENSPTPTPDDASASSYEGESIEEIIQDIGERLSKLEDAMCSSQDTHHKLHQITDLLATRVLTISAALRKLIFKSSDSSESSEFSESS